MKTLLSVALAVTLTWSVQASDGTSEQELLCVLEDNPRQANTLEIEMAGRKGIIRTPLAGSLDLRLSQGRVFLDDVALTAATVMVAGESTGDLSLSLAAEGPATGRFTDKGRIALPLQLGIALGNFFSLPPFTSDAFLFGQLLADGQSVRATVQSTALPAKTPVLGRAALTLTLVCRHSQAKAIVKQAIPTLKRFTLVNLDTARLHSQALEEGRVVVPVAPDRGGLLRDEVSVEPDAVIPEDFQLLASNEEGELEAVPVTHPDTFRSGAATFTLTPTTAIGVVPDGRASFSALEPLDMLLGLAEVDEEGTRTVLSQFSHVVYNFTGLEFALDVSDDVVVNPSPDLIIPSAPVAREISIRFLTDREHLRKLGGAPAPGAGSPPAVAWMNLTTSLTQQLTTLFNCVEPSTFNAPCVTVHRYAPTRIPPELMPLPPTTIGEPTPEPETPEEPPPEPMVRVGTTAVFSDHNRYKFAFRMDRCGFIDATNTFFNTSNPNRLLDQVTGSPSHATCDPTHADLEHLITGKLLDGTTIGLAHRPGLGDAHQQHTGLSSTVQRGFPSQLPCPEFLGCRRALPLGGLFFKGVFAHEVGHNLGATHSEQRVTLNFRTADAVHQRSGPGIMSAEELSDDIIELYDLANDERIADRVRQVLGF